VVSGTNHQELREEVFDLGVKIFIVKPFDPLQVAEIIGLLLL
jgi:AmiR/NasT family two-component response regulator